MPHTRHANPVTLRVRDITHMQFYAYRLASREGFSRIHSSRKLFLQYVLDAYLTVEGNRLEYIRQNQATIRAETYQGLLDFVEADVDPMDNTRPRQAGVRIVLPSSFLGGARYMQQQYNDAMAMVGRFGKPDFFITMTANPKWPDILAALPAGHEANFRPDIESRVFNLMTLEIEKDYNVNHVLGVTKCDLGNAEFQKTGHPHKHGLQTLRDQDKPLNAQDIDRTICAELPDPVTQPELYKIVTKYAILFLIFTITFKQLIFSNNLGA